MRKMKKIIDKITTAVLILVIVLAILLVGVRIFGLKPYTVLSGSMKPSIRVGSLIYIVDVDTDKLKPNDVITYVIDGGTVVTHRIINLVPDEEDPTLIRFEVKGDNNDDPDGEKVHPNNVIGKKVFSIPLIGYVAWFVQNPPGNFITIAFAVTLLLLTFLPELMDKLYEDDTPKKDENGENKEETPEN